MSVILADRFTVKLLREECQLDWQIDLYGEEKNKKRNKVAPQLSKVFQTISEGKNRWRKGSGIKDV